MSKWLSRIALLTLVMVALIVASGDAQSLAKRSRLEFQFGLAMRSGAGTAATSSGVISKTKAEGLLGSLGYSQWLKEELAATVNIGVLMADVDSRVGSSGVTSRTSVVVPIFAGVRRYFPKSTFGTAWRPYVSAAIGPVIGVEVASEVGSVVASEAMTRTAFAGRAGTGFDIQLSRLLMLGFSAGYNLMTDFPDEIGGHKNHSGADFGISLSFLWGRGVE
ncbi:MAG: hypothetical protein AMJ46_03530 [Latescibacteria bacterium DG_63]|nr:MAG: hypothetical protein AMJ46_03530 [Latescibacteria bacterium DG_63]